MNNYSARWNRLSSELSTAHEDAFLRETIPDLFSNARDAEPGSYVLSRFLEALDGLLDAAEDVIDARKDYEQRSNEQKHRREAAQDLQRAYFRVQQADYFVRQARHPRRGDFVKTSRRLYQRARSAYDEQRYNAAGDLADAAQEVIGALEKLAQAAVGIPEPPRL